MTQHLGQTGDTPLGSGGVVDLDRAYGGVGVRASHGVGSVLRFTAGFDADRMKERRRGFVNNNGIAGALRRDEDDTVANTDVYAQAEWTLLARWVLSGGARHSRVRFESRDHYVVGPNPDDSGSVAFSRTAPVAGILFKASDAWRLYANAGEGFETPTFAELAYRPGGATGLNFALRPSRSRHAEVGAKGRLGAARLNLAAFRIDTRDEIVVNSASGGRTDFRNASSTKRKGVEASVEGRMGALEYAAAYTWLDARFASTRLPGVPESVLHAQAVWRPAGGRWHAGVEAHAASKVYVNDANTDAAPAYEVFNLRAGYEYRRGRWHATAFVRVDNVADRRYVGSVIVSEARARFFEPAPGRTWTAGFQVVF